MKPLLLASLLGGIGLAATCAEAVLNPSYATAIVREFRISENADCSNSIRVFRDASATEQDYVANPSIGAGAIPIGTYRCIILETNDIARFKPDGTEGNCVNGTLYERDVFRAGSSSTAPDGSTVSGRSSGPTDLQEDYYWNYFSTTGSMSNGGTTPSTPFLLSSPLVVTGDRSITQVINQDGAIDGTQNPCELGPSTISFR